MKEYGHVSLGSINPPISVELTEMYIKDNAKAHQTDKFELVVDTPATPVLRRGQPFFLAIRFDRPFNLQEDMVRFIFEFGRFKMSTLHIYLKKKMKKFKP